MGTKLAATERPHSSIGCTSKLDPCYQLVPLFTIKYLRRLIPEIHWIVKSRRFENVKKRPLAWLIARLLPR